jgi:hypothetical protein
MLHVLLLVAFFGRRPDAPVVRPIQGSFLLICHDQPVSLESVQRVRFVIPILNSLSKFFWVMFSALYDRCSI